MAVFGKQEGHDSPKIMQELMDRVNKNMERLRIIEGRIKSLDLRMKTGEQSILNQTKNVNSSLGERDRKIEELYNDVLRLNTTVKEILKHLKLVATKSKVDELKELLNIYNPIESKFVTREEMEEFVSERTGENGK